MNIFTYLAIGVAVVAVLVEFYKKGPRGITDAEGRRRTKAKPWEVYIIAAICSAPWGVGIHTITEGENPIFILLWTVSIYAFQYIVDMAVIKKAVNALIARLGGKG